MEPNEEIKQRNMHILNQIRQFQYLRNNLQKILNNEELDDLDLDFDTEGMFDLKEKKSVIFPRIGRSPVTYPRIGAQKKRAVFQPRVGRNYEILDNLEAKFENDSEDFLNEEKRVPYKPRIGRK